MKRIVEVTADGSSTLYIPEMDEHYHSVHGAIQESQHVFIQSNLHLYRKQQITIFEVGFGTGLNALLTYKFALAKNLVVNYITVEKYPLTKPEYSILNYANQLNLSDNEFLKFHDSPWETPIKITPNFTLRKINIDFNQLNYNSLSKFDHIYFDAFAPNKQPDLWNAANYQKIYHHANSEAIFTTYCAKGVVRRDLQMAGFNIERIPGPPNKREMLRGIK